MSDLPERIWCDFDEETMDRGVFSDEHFLGDVEYLRADLSAPVGYSLDQVKLAYDEGLRFGIQEDMGSDSGEQANSLAELLATMTPAPVAVPSMEEILEIILWPRYGSQLEKAQSIHALLTRANDSRGGV
jgi:hypothetical protein